MVIVARRSKLTEMQKDLINRLERDETVDHIAEEAGVSRASVYQRIERLQYRGVIEHVGRGKYRLKPAQKEVGMILRITLQVTYNPKELSTEQFNTNVDRSLKKLNTALSDGYEVITQQLYSTNSGEQLVYILHKNS